MCKFILHLKNQTCASNIQNSPGQYTLFIQSLSVNTLSWSRFCWIQILMEPDPGNNRCKAGEFTQDMMPGPLQGTMHTQIHTDPHTYRQFSVPNSSTCMILDSVRKPGNPCKHGQNMQNITLALTRDQDLNQTPQNWEATMLPAVLLCRAAIKRLDLLFRLNLEQWVLVSFKHSFIHSSSVIISSWSGSLRILGLS